MTHLHLSLIRLAQGRTGHCRFPRGLLLGVTEEYSDGLSKSRTTVSMGCLN